VTDNSWIVRGLRQNLNILGWHQRRKKDDTSQSESGFLCSSNDPKLIDGALSLPLTPPFRAVHKRICSCIVGGTKKSPELLKSLQSCEFQGCQIVLTFRIYCTYMYVDGINNQFNQTPYCKASQLYRVCQFNMVTSKYSFVAWPCSMVFKFISLFSR
jgi:hypothetical protein